MKNKFKVYLTEEVEFSYMVEAETEEQAREIVLSGDYDQDSYNIEGANHCQILDVIPQIKLEGVTND